MDQLYNVEYIQPQGMQQAQPQEAGIFDDAYGHALVSASSWNEAAIIIQRMKPGATIVQVRFTRQELFNRDSIPNI